MSQQSHAAAALLTCALLFSNSVHADNAVQSLAGRYDQHHSMGLVGDSRTYGVDDVAEVVPVSKDAAYVRVSLYFYNGHRCSIRGVARAERGELIYFDPTPHFEDSPQCVLKISRDGNDLKIDDGDGSCKMYCGLRGGLTNVRLPFSSKQPIRYMAKLKASLQYQQAMEAWQSSNSH